MQTLKWFLLACTTLTAFLLLNIQSGIAIVAISAAVAIAADLALTE